MSDETPHKKLIDFSSMDSTQRYFFLISTVVPRPIAWISTCNEKGETNLAPFSFFQGVDANPPTIMVSLFRTKNSGDPKDTLTNIEQTEQFVVNLVPERLAEPMIATSAEFPAGTSEFDEANMTPVPSSLVKPPRVDESPVNLECRVRATVPLGSCVVVFGEILLAHVDEDLLDERGVIDPDRLRPLSRLGGSLYETYGGSVRIARPKK